MTDREREEIVELLAGGLAELYRDPLGDPQMSEVGVARVKEAYRKLTGIRWVSPWEWKKAEVR